MLERVQKDVPRNVLYVLLHGKEVLEGTLIEDTVALPIPHHEHTRFFVVFDGLLAPVGCTIDLVYCWFCVGVVYVSCTPMLG
jgi:hypothetical protein